MFGRKAARIKALNAENAELKALNRQLEDAATVDKLTGLKNRRAFDEEITRRTNEFIRFGGDLTLIMIDCNYFKEINDNFGHPIGDKALQIVADIIRKNTRNVDESFRTGGDEFAILTAQTDIDVFTKKLKHAVEQEAPTRLAIELGKASISPAGGTIEIVRSFSISAGSASIVDARASLRKSGRLLEHNMAGVKTLSDRLVRLADNDMFIDKRNGRQVV